MLKDWTFSKIRKKARMSALILLFNAIWQSKESKGRKVGKEKNKTVYIWRWHDFLHKKSQVSYNKQNSRTNNWVQQGSRMQNHKNQSCLYTKSKYVITKIKDNTIYNSFKETEYLGISLMKQEYDLRV